MKRYALLGVRHQTFFDGHSIVDSYLTPIPGSKCMIRRGMYAATDRPARTYYEKEDRERVARETEEEFRAGVYTQEFFDALDKSYSDVTAEIRTFTDVDFSEQSDEELANYLMQYYKIHLTTFHPMVWAIYASDLQSLFEEELKTFLPKNEQTEENIIECTALLLSPTRLTFVQQEEELLFSLQELFFAQDEDVEAFCETENAKKLLRALVEKFGWFHMEYVSYPWTVADYVSLLKKRVSEENSDAWKEQLPSRRLEITIEKQQEFFTKYNCSTLFRDLVFAMQEFLIVLDYSKAYLVEGFHFAKPLLEEIGKRTGAGDWFDVRCLSAHELQDLLLTGRKADRRLITDRKHRRTILLEDGKIQTWEGEEAKQAEEKYAEKLILEDADRVSGVVAYPGNVRGVVKVVTTSEDTKDFEQGMILVARDTTTELTSTIRKAAGIITNNGTLLSHTTIVAREFKIPCLILTKFATEVFSDGDTIELDTENRTAFITTIK